ncbi:MAG: glycosyltransferase family 2 protein [Rhodobacterales bacterium]|nr:glycosyltransferase family 2 protein [Rhodobacterales bacterium]
MLTTPRHANNSGPIMEFTPSYEVNGEDAPVLSIVTPMFNEEDGIERFLKTVRRVMGDLDLSYEIVCVNDGSQDGTFRKLAQAAEKDGRIVVIDLSRNFGKEAALTAGLDAARGQAVVPLDADLQEPPELIGDMVRLWRQGYDVVLAKRSDRSSDTRFKRMSARLFYSLIRRLSETDIQENVGDFRLMDRQVVEALRRLPERTRFMKGLFAWLGYRQTVVEFVRPPRQDGAEKQRFSKLLLLALDGIISFSSMPLRIWTYLGLIVAFLSMTYMVWIVGNTLIFGSDTPGFATLATALLFFNGLLMINMGILGEYVARIFSEVKARPVYLVRTQVRHRQARESDGNAQN